ncbi:MAG: 4-hydroxythreonine-4-phosphate dehydrogenase PdxA [Bdellovibrionota bacterium]
MKTPLRIGITTGDADGIGFEVTAKALAKLKPRSGVTFFLWRSPKASKRHLALIDRSFKRITVNSWPDALKVAPSSQKEIIDISSNLPPAIWVEMMAQASHFGHIDGMATAPLSKTAIKAAGLSDLGHTGILKRVTKTKDVFMGFIGDHFNVLLATGHLPVGEVTAALTESKLERAILAADLLRSMLDKKRATQPLALLGLNPHAGEEGMIGTVEMRVHDGVLKSMRTRKIEIEGPLVPDAAFAPKLWKRYSVYVANYHDQGLIPFKMIHGQESGIHVTLGLPFVRTSVDHGTAKDIFGTNKADYRSMLLALEWAVKLCRASTDLSIQK